MPPAKLRMKLLHMVTFPGLCISQFVKQVSSHFLPHDPPVSQLTKAEQILIVARERWINEGRARATAAEDGQGAGRGH